MDAFTVQEYVANWLNAGAVPGLDHAHPAKPTEDGVLFSEHGSGDFRCQALVQVGTDTDVRWSGPAANPLGGTPAAGVRLQTFNVRITVFHCSSSPDWTAAEKHLKQTVVPGLKKLIGLDPTLGTSGFVQPLFNSAGEGRQGFRVSYTDPESTEEGREQQATLALTVLAWVTA